MAKAYKVNTIPGFPDQIVDQDMAV